MTRNRLTRNLLAEKLAEAVRLEEGRKRKLEEGRKRKRARRQKTKAYEFRIRRWKARNDGRTGRA